MENTVMYNGKYFIVQWKIPYCTMENTVIYNEKYCNVEWEIL